MISFLTAMFPLLYTLTNGGPGMSAPRSTCTSTRPRSRIPTFGYSAALGVAVLVLVGILVVVQLRLVAREDDE